MLHHLKYPSHVDKNLGCIERDIQKGTIIVQLLYKVIELQFTNRPVEIPFAFVLKHL